MSLDYGDIVYAKSVAQRGPTSSLEYQAGRRDHYVCLLLGTATLPDLPGLPEIFRRSLQLGIVSLDDVAEVLGAEARDRLVAALMQKYPEECAKL